MKPLFSLSILLALGGCAALKKAETPATLRLAPSFAAGPKRDATLSLAPVGAQGLTAARRYAYVLASDPLVLNQAATLFWEVPPPQTLDRALGDAVAARFSGRPGSPSAGRLTGQLRRFEEVTGPSGASAVVALDVTLSAAGTVSSATLCRATPIASSTNGDRAAAFQASVAAVASAAADGAVSGRLVPLAC